MKLLTLLTVLFLESVSIYAQESHYLDIKGQILSKQTGNSVPYAHIYLENTNIGTISNAEGYFKLSLNSQQELFADNLIISCLDYENKIFPINNTFKGAIKIALIPAANLLDQVTISSQTGLAIIRKAITNIPLNYPSHSTALIGFYRISHDALTKGSLHIFEAKIEIRKKGYLKSNHQRMLRILKARKKEFDNYKLTETRFYGGPHLPNNLDFVMRRPSFVNQVNLKDYHYELEEVTKYNGKEIYIISFKPHSSTHGTAQGKFYIETDSYAFIEANISLTKQGMVVRNRNSSDLMYWYKSISKVSYRKFKDKWYLQNVHLQEYAYDNSIPDTIICNSEYVTTKIKTDNIDKIKYRDRLHYKDIYLSKVDTFDADFWKGHNILAQTKEFKALFSDTTLSNKANTTKFTPPPAQNK